MWAEADLFAFQQLAAELDQETGYQAALAVAELRWLAEQAGRVRATDPRHGVDWRTFPWADWARTLGAARAHVSAVAAVLHAKSAA
jgi:hypothetical protein